LEQGEIMKTLREDVDHRILSRRTLLAAAGGAAMAFTTGRIWVPQAWGQSVTGDQSPPSLITLVSRPYCAETPVRAFTSWVTPNEQFFVRSHFGAPPPERVDPQTWRLRVSGLVDRNLSLSLADLLSFDQVTVTAVVQCSGNGRAYFRPRVAGAQWQRGAVGNAGWTGVRLTDVLRQASVQQSGRHLQMLGADRPIHPKTPLFHRSIPMEKAMHADTILALRMNGEPLPLLHGSPARLIAPGWMADACVKWLTDLTVSHEEAPGFYMQTAYRYPVVASETGVSVDPTKMKPVEAMVVKSLIAKPDHGTVLNQGPVMIEGVGWTGEGRVVKVEVSVDGGQRWESAVLVGEDEPYAWRRWQFSWRAMRAGRFTLMCRATDDRGQTQPLTSPWNPSGYLWNGRDQVQVEVRA
jgi:sulfite oxidase